MAKVKFAAQRYVEAVPILTTEEGVKEVELSLPALEPGDAFVLRAVVLLITGDYGFYPGT